MVVEEYKEYMRFITLSNSGAVESFEPWCLLEPGRTQCVDASTMHAKTLSGSRFEPDARSG
jgi:hypothetical protein